MHLLSVYVSDKAVIAAINTLAAYAVMGCCLFFPRSLGVIAEDITWDWHGDKVPPVVSQF